MLFGENQGDLQVIIFFDIGTHFDVCVSFAYGGAGVILWCFVELESIMPQNVGSQ